MTSSNTFEATVHAIYHMAYAWGANFSHIFEILDSNLSIHCTSFMGL